MLNSIILAAALATAPAQPVTSSPYVQVREERYYDGHDHRSERHRHHDFDHHGRKKWERHVPPPPMVYVPVYPRYQVVTPPTVGLRFSNRDFDILVSWFGQRRAAFYPDAPYHLSRQLWRMGHAPQGYMAKMLPDDLDYRLGNIPRGYVRVLARDNVYLMDEETGDVIDILRHIR